MNLRPLAVALAGAVVLSLAAGAIGRQEGERASTAEHLVLITLDGARTEEIFGGLDAGVLSSTLPKGQPLEMSATYRRFWAPTPEERRRKLMPFFWTLVTEEGSIAGNRRLNSVVTLGNQHRVSYPGYAEILLGEAHDAAITNNDPIRNPYPTVLEGLRDHLGVPRDQVATFASWPVLNAIAEHVEGKTLVNAGIEVLGLDRPDVRLVDALQREAPTPWTGTRHDAFTFRLAKAHLEMSRPRVLYLAFDETDDWAHDGRYDRLLEAYAQTDAHLQELWTWLQSQETYRGRTHLLITTDHGRGHTAKDWRDHGGKVVGANEVWIAFASPEMARRGEWRGGAPLSTSQIAATIGSWMGLDWNAAHPTAGRPIR